MAQIYDRGHVWELDIFPGLAPVEILDEPDKGYRAVLSIDPATNRHVVANVTYSKDKYSIEEVLKKHLGTTFLYPFNVVELIKFTGLKS